MARSGFVPAWMKIPSSDKTNGNQKLNIDRFSHPTIISGRQRHHSSDIVDHTTSRHTLFYYSKSNEQSQNESNKQKSFFSFQFPCSSNNDHFNISSSSSRPINRHHYNQLSKQTLLLLSVLETSEEKELLRRMGWNDNMTYEITDKDKEEYEKRLKLLPKTDNRSARLISALNRRTLPCINIREMLQHEMIDSVSDDDSSDD